MSTIAPLAIGTRGTIGSLVNMEIDYFNRLSLDHSSCTSKLHQQSKDTRALHAQPASRANATTNSTSGDSENHGFGCFVTIGWRGKKKKRKININVGSFLPGMCSAVDDVNEGNRRLHGFNYRSLKADIMENL